MDDGWGNGRALWLTVPYTYRGDEDGLGGCSWKTIQPGWVDERWIRHLMGEWGYTLSVRMGTLRGAPLADPCPALADTA